MLGMGAFDWKAGVKGDGGWGGIRRPDFDDKVIPMHALGMTTRRDPPPCRGDGRRDGIGGAGLEDHRRGALEEVREWQSAPARRGVRDCVRDKA